MENGGKKIKKISLYECGYCVNNMKLIFKDQKKEIIKFPALCVLLEHNEFGNILFDTGYSKLIYENGIISKIYNLCNKTYFKDEDFILNKIKDKKINKIIISHAHPDHIGALKYFKDYELITSKEVFCDIMHPKLKNLVFKNMIPKDFPKVKILQDKITDNLLSQYFEDVYDILEDKSILGIKLSGHSNGQIGIYLPEYKLFFSADSSWGSSFNKKITNMKIIPKFIQNNFIEYNQTINKIEKLKQEHKEIKIIYSHEQQEEKIYE